MKKKNVINLIRFYSQKNDAGFRTEAYEIAADFQKNGDEDLAEYIMALLSESRTFMAQSLDSEGGEFLEKIEVTPETLLLPESIRNDMAGLVNAVERGIGIGKFLFVGAPGTGKTETARHLAFLLNRDLYMVNIPMLIDSKLGQTPKNISGLFAALRDFAHPENLMVLFDELDALALDRTNSRDLREMGRAVSTLLKELDRLDPNIVLTATTNLYQLFDLALTRRFDAVVDFDRYEQSDLKGIAEKLFNNFVSQYKQNGRDVNLFRKILSLNDKLPLPGELKNKIRKAIAFSDPHDEAAYLRRLYLEFSNEKTIDPIRLKAQKFSLREMETLCGVPRSSLSRSMRAEQGTADE